MSREGKLVRNTLILSIGTFLPKLASFVTLPILTGCLTKSEYGTYDLIMVLVSLLLPTVTLQVQAAAFRFLIDSRDDNKSVKSITSNIIAFIAPTSFVSLVILFFCLYSQPLWNRIFICLYFLVDIYVNAARQVARGLEKNIAYSISAILSALGKMVFTVVCVYFLRTGMFGTIVALFMASLFSLIYLVFKAKLFRYVSIKSIDLHLLKKMLQYSWPMVPNSMSAWVMRVSDRFVVTAFLGASSNAIYAVANKIPSLLNLAQSTFTMAWQENASIVSKDNDAGEYYSHMFRVTYDLMAGFFGLLIGITPMLFRLLIRGDYLKAYYQMPILFLGMFFFSLSTFIGGIYVAFLKSKSVGITTSVAALINIVVDLATIKWIGLYAASGSTLVAYVFLFIFRVFDVRKIADVRVDWKHSICVLIIMIIESVFCYMKLTVLNIVNLFIGILLFVFLNKSLVKKAVIKLGKVLRKK